MSATATAKVEPAAVTWVNIADEPGARLDIGQCRFTADHAAANLHLLCLLGELCGRCEPSGGGGYIERGTPETWLTLRQVDAPAVELVVRRVERAHGGWHVDGGEAVTALDRLAVHWGRAQVRWKRERSG